MNKSGIKIAAIVVLIVIALAFSIKPFIKDTSLGLDLQGGAEITLQAIPEEGETITSDDMTSLQEIIRKRVDSLGITEPVIQLVGNDRILVSLAGVDNPEEAVELIGKTAKLEFRDPDGNIILSGSDLEKATGVSVNGQVAIDLNFNEEGTKKFASATARLVNQKISIYLDNELLTDPRVDEPITDGNAQITSKASDFTLEYAIGVASLLNGGALPVNVEIIAKRTVGPTLGVDSLQKSLIAALVGLSILFIFMLIYYRLMGVVAIISLILYGLLLMWALNLLGVVLTLPGIAGFILSIGMAVDANIIIYERIREEMYSGKSTRASIEAGFKRAMRTIIDSNVTTLIAAAVLFKFGTGSIQGFALILAIGIIISMLTALTFNHYILRWSVDVRSFGRKQSLYTPQGGKK